MEKKQILLGSLLTALLLAVDQVTKVLASAFIGPVLAESQKSFIPIIGDFFTFNYAQNRGAFLSLGNNLNEITWFLLMVIVPVIILGAVVIYFIRRPKALTTLQLWMGVLLISGGVGNLIDRVIFGKVTDFMNLGIGPVFRSGIFNVADLYIVALVVIVVFTSFGPKKKK